jgi:Leucine-rich repeat (LRR) protein
MLNDFPQLYGIRITNADSFTILNDDLFTEDFGAIQYLDLYGNKIATIEANAFQQLTKLKWISLGANQLSSLPHQIFRNNPELVSVGLNGNKINSVTPNFFKTLEKLNT